MEAYAAANSAFPSATVLRLEGEFDLYDRMRLQDAFAIAAASPLVVIDFEKTSFIDSSVLQCLIALWKFLRERNSQLRLVSLSHHILHLFKICQLEQLFDIRSSLLEAIGNDVSADNLRRLTVLGADSATPYRRYTD